MSKKYKGTTMDRLALLHVIGQLAHINGYAKLSEIASFMGVTKPTAMKYMKSNIENCEVIFEVCEYRSNAKRYEFRLHPDMEKEYDNREYWNAYQAYAMIRKGVRLGK